MPETTLQPTPADALYERLRLSFDEEDIELEDGDIGLDDLDVDDLDEDDDDYGEDED